MQEAEMKAGEIMTRGAARVRATTSVSDAIALMIRNNISGLPVVNDDARLIGIVTEGDFLRRAEIGTERQRPRWLEFLLSPGRLAGEYVATHGRKVGEVMTRDVVAVTEDTPIDELVRLMEHHRIKRLPVVDADRRVIGIVSRANLLRAVLSTFRPGTVLSTDSEVKAKIITAMENLNWMPRASVSVDVVEGVVTFSGAVSDPRAAEALRVLAENTPGVDGIRSEIVFVDPLSGAVFEAAD
jgi:CBS domain-containing protein